MDQAGLERRERAYLTGVGPARPVWRLVDVTSR